MNSQYPSFDDWISLMDPNEQREHPMDELVEVMGATDHIQITYFSSRIGDWMSQGDPTHWRPIKK